LAANCNGAGQERGRHSGCALPLRLLAASAGAAGLLGGATLGGRLRGALGAHAFAAHALPALALRPHGLAPRALMLLGACLHPLAVDFTPPLASGLAAAFDELLKALQVAL